MRKEYVTPDAKTVDIDITNIICISMIVPGQPDTPDKLKMLGVDTGDTKVSLLD